MIKRRKYGTGFAYYVDGAKLPGVTTILKMLPHDAFAVAAARKTAEYALDHWAELGEMPLSKRLRTLEKAQWEQVRDAAVRGTEVHKLGAMLADGQLVTVPDALAGHVEAYRDWLDTTGVAPVEGATELTIANRTVGYCGTADLVADLPDLLIGPQLIPAARWLLGLEDNRLGRLARVGLAALRVRARRDVRAPRRPRRRAADELARDRAMRRRLDQERRMRAAARRYRRGRLGVLSAARVAAPAP